MALYTYNGVLLARGGQLSAAQACCCGGDGACCLPETELCIFSIGPCEEGGVCPDGFICNEMGNCIGQGTVPIGTCTGTVLGPGDPATCTDDLTQSACESQGGTFYPGQTCAENPCPPPTGACCSCAAQGTSFPGPFTGQWFLQVFCTGEEANARYQAIQSDLDSRAAEIASALSANGWTCVTPYAFVFSDMVGNNQGPFYPPENPDCELDSYVYRNAEEQWGAYGYCCGTIDTNADPIDLGYGVQAYPCVGPYSYTCTDGVEEGNCCGVFHADKTCAEEPCKPKVEVCCRTLDGNPPTTSCEEGVKYGRLPIGFDWATFQYIWNEETNCETCYSHLCSSGPGIMYLVNDCSECLDPLGNPSPFCSGPGQYGFCGTLVEAESCEGNPCDNPLP